MDDEDMVCSYKQISQNEAKKMMEQDDGHVIVDVRRPDEFAAGHIPGAICIPNENIENVVTGTVNESTANEHGLFTVRPWYLAPLSS